MDEIKAGSDAAVAIGPFGSRMKADTYVPVGIPVIRGLNISDTTALSGEFVYVSENKADELASSNVFDGDLVFPHRGSIGQVGIVTGGRAARFVLSTSLMKLTVDRKIADPHFIFYFFRSPMGRFELLKNASQVGTPGIATPLASLRSVRVPLPPLYEQRAIARMLGSLDGKIELNRRMNDTLEATARAIFKSWFVDFDPVRATASVPDDPRTLFPNRLEDSPIGHVPEGWTLGAVADIAENVRDQVLPSELAPETPYIGLEHMPRRSTSLSEWGAVEGVASGKSAFERGDVLFGKLRPYFHKVGLAPINGVCSTDILVIRPIEGVWRSLVLFQCSSDEFVAHAVATSTGTRMPRTSWKDLARYPMALPPEPLAAALEELVGPLLDRMTAGIFESRLLAETRDYLLPKLISGGVRVGPLNEKSVPAKAHAL